MQADMSSRYRTDGDFPHKVWVTLYDTVVKGVAATFEASLNGGHGAFGRPPAARFGEPVALGVGLGGAALFAEGNWAKRENVMTIPEASDQGGGDGVAVKWYKMVGRTGLVGMYLSFAGFT